MNFFTIAVLVVTALLNGMETVYSADYLRKEEKPFYRVWLCRKLYLWAFLWLLVHLGAGTVSERGLYLLRLADMVYIYLLLAAVDIKRRIVPDAILVCFLAGQLLWSGLMYLPDELIWTLVTGVVFFAAVMLFTWMSRGKMGMGDAALLGITALTAGWAYVVQILVIGLMLAFLYGIGLLLFRRISMKTEIPFVPFLAAAMVIHTIYIVR